jgi:hypothetical protein
LEDRFPLALAQTPKTESDVIIDAAVHGMLELTGKADRWRRPPYYSLNDQQMERLADFLKRQGVL